MLYATAEMRHSRATITSFGVLVAAFFVLYGRVIAKLITDWSQNDNYSHGFVIAPVAGYFVWERRERFRTLPIRPQLSGLVVVMMSLGALYIGVVGAELFTTRLSMIATLAGALVFLFGWQHVRVLAFPLVFLMLMIPLPAMLFNQIAFPLQLVASRIGAVMLSVAGVPVYREGNIIFLAKTTLDVAEACSGIRSLMSLLTLGILYAYFADRRTSVRLLFTLAALPVAIVTNSMRVAGTGIAAQYYGASAATGFLHTFSGWMMFAASLGLLITVMRLILWVRPANNSTLSLGEGIS